MQETKSRRKVFTFILALLLLISGFYALYCNISIAQSLIEIQPTENSTRYSAWLIWLMSKFIDIAMAITKVCLAGMLLLGKGNRANRTVWIFYIIGSLVSHILYIISQQKMYGSFFDDLIYAVKNRYIPAMTLYLPQIQSLCLSVGLVTLLLAMISKAGPVNVNKRKTLWFVGSIALVLHIIASALYLVSWNIDGIEPELIRGAFKDFIFDIVLDAALFIKLSLETVWTDMTLPVPEQTDLPAQTNSPVMEVKEEGPKMKYCTHCGKEIMDAAVVCPHCGCPVNGEQTVDNTPSTGLNVVSFLIPFVGLILYLVYHDKAPQRAAAIGKWALIGLVVDIVLSGFYYGAVLSAFM